MKIKLISCTIIGLMIAGCATSYQSNGFSGGYSDLKLQDNVFKISFRGNGYTNEQRAADFALLHAAEVALENGYGYFAVVDEKETTQNFLTTTPTTAHTTGTVYLNSPAVIGGSVHAVGNSGSYSGTTTYSGGQIVNIRKPTATYTIACFKEKPITNDMIYDAKQLARNLGKNYGVFSPINKLNEQAEATLKIGVPRELVLTEIGQPSHSEVADGKKIDIYEFEQDYSEPAKISRTVVHIAADWFTLFLYELIRKRVEKAIWTRQVKSVKAVYGLNGAVESVTDLKK